MDSFDAMYLRFREPVLGYFARRVGDPEVAADLMAETFARALVRYRSAPPDDPAAWLFVIARNLLVDSARRGQVEESARRKLHLEPLVLDDHDLRRIEEIAEAADLADTVRRRCCPRTTRHSAPASSTRSPTPSSRCACAARRRSCASASAERLPTCAM